MCLDHFLHPNIWDVVNVPITLCFDRFLLQDNQILGFSSGSVTHADSALVPDNHVNKVQIGINQPRQHTLAEMEFVHPQEQVSTWQQNTVNLLDEFNDGVLIHLSEV